MISKLKSFFFLWKYYFHNKRHFKKKTNSNSIVLVENNALCDSHIVYSYLANILSQELNSKIYSYNPNFFNNKFREFIFNLKFFFFISYRYIYKSFGVEKNIIPRNTHKKKLLEKFDLIKDKLLEKSDIYDIKLENLNVGDLIYDGFLRKYDLPTIDVNSKIFEIKKTMNLKK